MGKYWCPKLDNADWRGGGACQWGEFYESSILSRNLASKECGMLKHYKDDRIKLIKHEFLGEDAWNKNSKGSRDCGYNTVG